MSAAARYLRHDRRTSPVASIGGGSGGAFEKVESTLAAHPYPDDPRVADLEAEVARLAEALAAAHADASALRQSDQHARLAMRASEERLATALDAGRVGDFDWDLLTGEISWSANLMEIVGLPRDTQASGADVSNLIHPDDRAGTQAAVEAALAGSGQLDTSYRVIGADGATRWIVSRGRVVRDAAGQPTRLVGVNYDVTDTRETEDRLRESQTRLQTLTDNLPGVVLYQVVTTRDLSHREYVYVSANSARVLGIPADVAMASHTALVSRIAEDQIDNVLAAERHAVDTLSTLDIEVTGQVSRGELRTRIISSPRELPDGRLIWDGILIDITERKRAEEAASRNAALLNAIGAATPDLIFAKDLDGRYLYANAATVAATGRAEDGVIGCTDVDLGSNAAQAAAIAANDAGVLASGNTLVIDETFTSPAGEVRVYRSVKAPMYDASGRIIGLAGVATDVSEQVEADRRLRASEDQMKRSSAEQAAILAQLAEGVIVTDADGRITFVNDAAIRIHGVERLDVAPADYSHEYHLFTEDGAPYPPDQLPLARAVTQGVVLNDERWRIRAPDGRDVVAVGSARPVFGGDGERIGSVLTLRDDTARHSAECALREQSRTLETLNEIAGRVSAELDLQRLVQMVTDAGVELTGAQFGAFFYNVLNESGGSYMLFTLSGAKPEEFDFGMPRLTPIFHPTFTGASVVRSDDILVDARYGQNAPHKGMPEGHLPVRSYLAVPVTSRSGEVIGGLLFGHPEPGRFDDRHERLITAIAAQAAIGIDNARLFQSAQAELENRERAEQALRLLNDTLEQRVADEIAHRGEAEEALRQVQKMETLGQLTGGVAHDFNNLLQIVTGNLELLQRGLSDDQPRLRRAAENAARGAERAAILTQRLLAFSRRQPLAPRAIKPNHLIAGMTDLLHRTLGETVVVDTRLAPDLWPVEADPHQLENAILNLAINGRDAMEGGGRLTIATGNLRHDRAALHSGELAVGDYVTIIVTDTGAGMDADTVARACEPFFTTKDVGRGTGLGLSMAYGFAKQSGGQLVIESRLGVGTSVTIALPRLHGGSVEAEAPADETPAERGRNETILVCEDDEDVRTFTVQVLRELGYQVLDAEDGPAALSLVRQFDTIDLLFTDVVLPGGMTGADVAADARTLRPGLKVLFTTGYARDAIVHGGRIDPGVELITKPFGYTQLAARVRALLDAA